MSTNLLDYLLIRAQVMILGSDVIEEIYSGYDVSGFLSSLYNVLRCDDFVLLDDKYLETIFKITSHFRSTCKISEINDICNDIIIHLNSHIKQYTKEQRLNMQERYLEIQRKQHHIDKYPEIFNVEFFKELLPDEFYNINLIADGLNNGAKIYDENGNIIKEVDIIKEQEQIDLPYLGIGEENNTDTYWYISSYNLTFTTYVLLDKLSTIGKVEKETLEFMRALLKLAEKDKKINKVNYISDNLEDIEQYNFITKFQDKYVDLKANHYCSKKTKALIKELDTKISTSK